MTKETFDMILNEVEDKSRLVITCNVIEGHGINGTDTTQFCCKRNAMFRLLGQTDEYVVVWFGYNGYMRKIFLPYDTIAWVEEREYDATIL